MNDGSKIGNKLNLSRIWGPDIISHEERSKLLDIGAEMEMPPIKQHRSLKPPLNVRVTVWNGNKVIRDHQKDFRSHITREWINDLLLWAMNHKFRVEFHAE